jgi:Uma2 family endonuclease
MGAIESPQLLTRHLYTVADYYRLSAAGVLGPEDRVELIEVSGPSARVDREIKVPLYASAGVPEVWVFDLDARLLRCYREPRGDEYMQTQVLAQPGLMPLPGLAGLQMDVSGLLPSA